MTPIQVTFAHKAETKNKQRFEEVVAEGQKPLVGAFYLDKETAGDAKTVEVAITLK